MNDPSAEDPLLIAAETIFAAWAAAKDTAVAQIRAQKGLIKDLGKRLRTSRLR